MYGIFRYSKILKEFEHVAGYCEVSAVGTE